MIEDKILAKLLMIKFSCLKNRNIELQWKNPMENISKLIFNDKYYKSIQDVPGALSSDVLGAWIRGTEGDIEPVIYLNKDIQIRLRDNLDELTNIIEHELLHIETGLFDGKELEAIAKKRGMYYFNPEESNAPN